jgi:hypothetical protein
MIWTDQIHLEQVRVKWKVFMNMVMSLEVSWKVGNFLTTRVTFIFSKTQHHEVNELASSNGYAQQWISSCYGTQNFIINTTVNNLDSILNKLN